MDKDYKTATVVAGVALGGFFIAKAVMGQSRYNPRDLIVCYTTECEIRYRVIECWHAGSEWLYHLVSEWSSCGTGEPEDMGWVSESELIAGNCHLYER